MSLQDPVERDLPGVTQVQVQPFGELTYERALRSLLRQDPQVLVLGEVRDAAAAAIAMQAALLATVTAGLAMHPEYLRFHCSSRCAGWSMLETLLIIALLEFTLVILGPTLLRVIRVPALAEKMQNESYQREQTARRLLTEAWSAHAWSLNEAQDVLYLKTPAGELLWRIQPDHLLQEEGETDGRQTYLFVTGPFAEHDGYLWLTYEPTYQVNDAARPAGPRMWLLRSQPQLLPQHAGGEQR